MAILDAYRSVIDDILSKIEKEEGEKIKTGAALMAEKIMSDELIHVYGTGGHSGMVTEELFHRNGGLVPINPVFDQGLSPYNGCRGIERCEGYAKFILNYFGVASGDLLIINSMPGINPVTIDAALWAQENDVKTIGITSGDFHKAVPAGHQARHSTNKNLCEEVDIFINTHVPAGDVAVKMQGCDPMVGAISTFAGTFIANALVLRTVEVLVEKGFKPPVWVSQNIPGGDEANEKYMKSFRPRIKLL